MPRMTTRLVSKQRSLHQHLPQEHVTTVQPVVPSQSVTSHDQTKLILRQDSITQEQLPEKEIAQQHQITQEKVVQGKTQEEIAQEEIAQEEIAQEEIEQKEIEQEEIVQEEIAQAEIEQEEIAQDEIARDNIAQDEIAPDEVEDHIVQHQTAQEEIVQDEIVQDAIAQEQIANQELTQEQITQQIIQEKIIQAQVRQEMIDHQIMLLQSQLHPKRKSDLIIQDPPLLVKRTQQSPSAFNTLSQNLTYVVTSNSSQQYVSNSTPSQTPVATKTTPTVMHPSLQVSCHILNRTPPSPSCQPVFLTSHLLTRTTTSIPSHPKNQQQPTTTIPRLPSSKRISPHAVQQQRNKTLPTTPTKNLVPVPQISPRLNSTRPTSGSNSNRMPLHLSQRKSNSSPSSSSSSQSTSPSSDKALPSSSRKYLQTSEIFDTSDFDNGCRAAETDQQADAPSKLLKLEDTYRNLVSKFTNEYRSLFSPFKRTPPRPIRFEFVPQDHTDEEPDPPSVRIYGDYLARTGFYLQGNLVQPTTSDRTKSRTCKESDLHKYETHYLVTLDTKQKRNQLILYITNLFFFTQFIVLTNKDLLRYLEDPYDSPIVNTKLWTIPDVTKYQARALDRIHSFKENSSPHIRQYIDARFEVATFILQAAYPERFPSPIPYSLVIHNVRTLYVKENRKYLLHKSRFHNVGESPNLCHTELCFYWPFQLKASDNSASSILVQVAPPGEPVDT